MSEHDTTDNPKHALILRLIQEKVAAKLDDLENNRNANDSLLQTLKTEIDALIESGNTITSKLQEAESHTSVHDKGRRPSTTAGKSDKPHSVTNVSEEKKTDTSHKTQKKTDTTKAGKTDNAADQEGDKEEHDNEEKSEEQLVEDCKNALKPLDFNKVQMIAATNPPPKVVKVFEVVCTLLGEKATWDNAKKVIKFKDFLKKIGDLKAEDMSDKTYHKVKQIITDEGLKPQALASASLTAKQLCQWINSFVKLREIRKGHGTEAKEVEESHSEKLEHKEEHTEEKKEGEEKQEAGESHEEKSPQELEEREYTMSLQEIDMKDLQTLKSFVNPPEKVAKVLGAVCIVLGEKESFPDAKKLLADTQKFIIRLRELRPESVSKKTYLKVKKILDAGDITPEKVAPVSIAARALSQWLYDFAKFRGMIKDPEGAIEDPEEEKKDHEKADAKDSTKKNTKKVTDSKASTDKTAPKRPVTANKKDDKKDDKAKGKDTKKTEKKDDEEKGKTEEVEENEGDEGKTPQEIAEREYKKSLDKVDMKDLQTLKSFKIPPPKVGQVLETVCIALGETVSFAEAKKLLLDPRKFINRLKELRPESVSNNTYLKVKKVLDAGEITPENLAPVSSAAKMLSQWLYSFVKLREIIKGPEGAIEEPEEEKKEEEPETKASTKKDTKKATDSKASADKTAPKRPVTANKKDEKKDDKAKGKDTKKTEKKDDEEKEKTEEVEEVAENEGDEGKTPQEIAERECTKYLNKLELRDLQMLKSFANPPAKVTKLLEIVCLTLGEKTTRENIKKLLVDSQKLLKRIKELRPESISNNTYLKVKKIMQEEEESLGTLDAVSAAAGMLYRWLYGFIKLREIIKGPEGAIEEPEEEKKQEEEAEGKGSAKKDTKKATDSKATTDKNAPKRPVTAAKKDEKKEEKKDNEDKAKNVKKDDKDKTKEKDAKQAITTPKGSKDKAPKEEKKAPVKATETKKQTEKPELKAILDTISSSDLTELKSMAKPVPQVLDTVNLVSLLVQGKEHPWAELTKTFLANSMTLHKVLNIDLAGISQENIDAVNKKIADHNLDEAVISKKSSPAVALFKWVKEAIKISEQAKEAIKNTEQNGEEKAHEESHAADTHENKEEHSQPKAHLNGEQAHNETTEEVHKGEEAVENKEQENKEEPAKVEENHQENKINHKEVFEKLSEVLEHDVTNEVNEETLENYVNEKIKHFEDEINALNRKNEELKNAPVPENTEEGAPEASNNETECQLNEEKIKSYNDKQDKVMAIAHKYNIPIHS